MQGISQETFEKKKKDWKFDLRNPETVYLIYHWRLRTMGALRFFSPKFIFLHFRITHTPKVSQMRQRIVVKMTVTAQIKERWTSYELETQTRIGWLCTLLSPLPERRSLMVNKIDSLKLCLTHWQSSELPSKLYLDLKQTSEENLGKYLVPFPREVEGKMNKDTLVHSRLLKPNNQ